MRSSPRPRRRRFTFTRPGVALACSLALTLAGQAARAQTTYNYTGPVSTTVGGSLWSTAANWTATVGTGTSYPGSNGSTTTDQAALTDTTANRIVTYDTGATGYLGALNITETSGFTNEVVFLGSAITSTGTNTITSVASPYTINTWQIAQNVTLGSTNGTAMLFVNGYGDPASAANTTNGTGGKQLILKIGTTGGGTLTINSGGVFETLPGSFNVNNNGNLATYLTGNVVINSGGVFNSDRAVFASTVGAGITQIQGSLTMAAGGTLNLTAPNTLGLALSATPVTDNRTYCTNLQITGGTINQLTGGTSSAASTTLNQSSIYAQGTTNYLTNATFNPGTYIELASSGTNQTFFSNVTLNNIVTRNFNAGTSAVPVYALRTIGAANSNGTVNSAGTLVMGQLQFGDAAAYGSTAVQFASNVTAKSGSLLPNRQNTANTFFNTIDVAGFTYDLTQVLQTSANNNGIFSLTTTNNGAATAFGNNSAAIVGTYNVTSSMTGGVVKATGFDLSGGGTTGSVNVTNLSYNGVAQTNYVTLQATGGPATANNLSGSASTSAPALAISPTSTFLYSGTGTAASPATLTATNRTIGMLAVSAGFLQVNPTGTGMVTGGAVNVTGGGLDLSGTNYGALTLNAGNFSLSNATLVLTLGGNLDTVTAAGSGQSFALTNATIALNGTNSGTSYQVFNNFTGANTVTNVTFTNVPAGETASIDTTGLITFTTAVPEPGTWVGGLLLVGALGLWGRRRRQQAVRPL